MTGVQTCALPIFNGYVEVAGDRADIVMANRNGITVNGGGFLNSGRVTLTSGKLNISDGELKTIDVESGNVRIGEKGIDALSLLSIHRLTGVRSKNNKQMAIPKTEIKYTPATPTTL